MAIIGTVLLALTSTTTTQYTLTAATYILPGLFGYPFSDQASRDLAMSYIDGTLGGTDTLRSTATVGGAPASPVNVLYYPWQLPPVDGLQSGSVIFGYSDGAFTATTYKGALNQYWANNQGVRPDIAFVLIGNQNRPNGGIMARMNLGATPTQTVGDPGAITTYDIVRQYDAVADYPTNPLDFLAVANAAAGFVLVHMDYFSVDMSQAVLQGAYGDTKYYLIPTNTLPLLMPLDLVPVVGPILADTIDPVLRVLVEAGYDRTINPGVPTPFNLMYFPDPAALSDNLRIAFLTGLDNGLEDLGMSRLFGTVKPGPYGVGGPPVTLPGDPLGMTTAAGTEAPATPTAAAAPSSTEPIAKDTSMPTGLAITASTDSTAAAAPSSTEPTTVQTDVNAVDTTTSPTVEASTSPDLTPETTQAPPPSTPPPTKPEQPPALGPVGPKLPRPKISIPAFGPPGRPAKPDSLGTGTTAGTWQNRDEPSTGSVSNSSTTA